jgi:hypothetical protein
VANGDRVADLFALEISKLITFSQDKSRTESRMPKVEICKSNERKYLTHQLCKVVESILSQFKSFKAIVNYSLSQGLAKL